MNKISPAALLTVGATLITVPGMGHDLPEPLWAQIIDAVVANTALAPV